MTDRIIGAPARAPAWLATAAAALGGAAIFNAWSAARAERDHPPIGSFVDVDGVRVHYRERGSGRPIVLIHGSGSLIEDWVVSGLFDRLAGRHRVIAFDRPGYGYTPRARGTHWTAARQAALLVEACAKLGAHRPLVVGHSWGTLVALAWALDHPDRIGALALLSGYYFATPRPDAAFAALAGAPVVGDLFAHTIAPLQTRVTGPIGNRMIFAPNAPTETFLNDMPFVLMLRPGQLRATAADSGQMPKEAAGLSPRYAELSLPMAIVWGEGDKLVDQQVQSAALAGLLGHAIAVPLPRKGHMIHHVEPQRVADILEQLVRR